jgi:hypothetical protein
MYYFSGDVCSLQITPCSSFSSGTYYYDILVYLVQINDMVEGAFITRAA